jgi:hypothetical protein
VRLALTAKAAELAIPLHLCGCVARLSAEGTVSTPGPANEGGVQLCLASSAPSEMLGNAGPASFGGFNTFDAVITAPRQPNLCGSEDQERRVGAGWRPERHYC